MLYKAFFNHITKGTKHGCFRKTCGRCNQGDARNKRQTAAFTRPVDSRHDSRQILGWRVHGLDARASRCGLRIRVDRCRAKGCFVKNNPAEQIREDLRRSVRNSAKFFALAKKTAELIDTMQQIGPQVYRIEPDILISLRSSLSQVRDVLSIESGSRLSRKTTK